MSIIKWGIIGCGKVTEIKSGQAYNKVPNSKLVAVMRRDANKAADYAARHHASRWYTDANDLLNDDEVNAVSVATPPAFHLQYALAALQKGLNVYVEKPVTINAQEAEILANAVKEYDGKLAVAHYRRALPMFLYVKELLENNTIGEVRTVQIRMWKHFVARAKITAENNWRVFPELSGGGYFHDLAPHQLDLMLYYFGEPEMYHGFSLNQANLYPAADHVCGQILFKNKVVVNGSWCFNVADNEAVDSCEIIGTTGKISFPFFGESVTCKNETMELTKNFTHPEHIQQPLITKIVAYFNDEEPNPSPIEDALTLMKIMDAFSVQQLS